ncbi:MAG TPA: hypothetical protein VEG33_17100 [Streptosporangiaceae bacterium]|nr:hypothetical protein [Streptosporangiaceae bacterium]
MVEYPDWRPGDAPLPASVLREVVAAVHAVGGRVAVHSQHAAGGAVAVEAGVDSLEPRSPCHVRARTTGKPR